LPRSQPAGPLAGHLPRAPFPAGEWKGYRALVSFPLMTCAPAIGDHQTSRRTTARITPTAAMKVSHSAITPDRAPRPSPAPRTAPSPHPRSALGSTIDQRPTSRTEPPEITRRFRVLTQIHAIASRDADVHNRARPRRWLNVCASRQGKPRRVERNHPVLVVPMTTSASVLVISRRSEGLRV
jgi:hypothetical protein